MSIVTRLATIADAEAIAGLLAEIMGDHDLAAPPLAQLADAARSVIGGTTTDFIVAEAAGRIVGCLQLVERFSTWANARYGYVEDFVTSAAARNRGIGALLIEHTRRLAAERGWDRIDLDVEEGNRAISFYERQGFHRTGYTIYRLETRAQPR
ncbi:MAG TPA: GNAT family N-acetyltransferase [Thermomicrobiales bacterium]|jgi:ribosomal protein S18 acetylase RimI-like enzyme